MKDLWKTVLATLAFAAFIVPSAWAGHETEAFNDAIKPIISEYLVIEGALAADNTTGVRGAAQRIVGLADKLDTSAMTGEHAAHFRSISVSVRSSAAALAEAGDLAAMREAFKELSAPLAMWVGMSGTSDLNVVYCSMAKGTWLQRDSDVRNPYLGQSMMACGEIVSGPAAGGAHESMHGHMH